LLAGKSRVEGLYDEVLRLGWVGGDGEAVTLKAIDRLLHRFVGAAILLLKECCYVVVKC
jgi:hypothetical protein